MGYESHMERATRLEVENEELRRQIEDKNEHIACLSESIEGCHEGTDELERRLEGAVEEIRKLDRSLVVKSNELQAAQANFSKTIELQSDTFLRHESQLKAQLATLRSAAERVFDDIELTGDTDYRSLRKLRAALAATQPMEGETDEPLP